MTELASVIANGLADYYEFLGKQLHKWVDPLSNEQFWHNPYPYGNSVGHLVLHLTGNLSYYIGARSENPKLKTDSRRSCGAPATRITTWGRSFF